MNFTLAHLCFILTPGAFGFYIGLFLDSEITSKTYIKSAIIGVSCSLFVFLYWFSLFGKYLNF